MRMVNMAVIAMKSPKSQIVFPCSLVWSHSGKVSRGMSKVRLEKVWLLNRWLNLCVGFVWRKLCSERKR